MPEIGTDPVMRNNSLLCSHAVSGCNPSRSGQFISYENVRVSVFYVPNDSAQSRACMFKKIHFRMIFLCYRRFLLSQCYGIVKYNHYKAFAVKAMLTKKRRG
jgi:hypothetical protein